MIRSNSFAARSSGDIDEISGARGPRPFAGAVAGIPEVAATGSAATVPERPSRWPIKKVTKSSTAIAGTSQAMANRAGVALAAPLKLTAIPQ